MIQTKVFREQQNILAKLNGFWLNGIRDDSDSTLALLLLQSFRASAPKS